MRFDPYCRLGAQGATWWRRRTSLWLSGLLFVDVVLKEESVVFLETDHLPSSVLSQFGFKGVTFENRRGPHTSNVQPREDRSRLTLFY